MALAFELQPTLRGELLELRPQRPDDFDALYEVASDPSIWQQHPNSDRHERPVFRALFDAGMASGGALVAVERASGRVMGGSRFYDFDAAASSIVIGYTFLGRAWWGGRYNAEMKRLMIEHAFRFVGAVYFHAAEANLRSLRALEKIGATRVGETVGRDLNRQPVRAFVYRVLGAGREG